ncbi:benzoate/H(+) symporter BenE family transporter [Paenibacillus sp. P26]|nr:benzoate/H(+) symporter BenE family transporter [Paenibacillus sp. P26]
MGNAGFILTLIGFACQVTYFFTRWAEAGHIPNSNMYEFMTMLGMMIVLAFIIVFLLYRAPVLGIFALPVAVIMIAYASVFPHDVATADPGAPELLAENPRDDGGARRSVLRGRICGRPHVFAAKRQVRLE